MERKSFHLNKNAMLCNILDDLWPRVCGGKDLNHTVSLRGLIKGILTPAACLSKSRQVV